MRFVLTGTVLGRPARLVLPRDRAVVGSAEDSDLRLADPTVSRRHAALQAGEEAVEVRDLGSSNGTFLDGVPVSRGTARPGAELGFGSVVLGLELVAEDDLEAGLRIPGPATPPRPPEAAGPAPQPPATTLDLQPLDSLLLERLPALLEAAAEGRGAATVAARAGGELFEALPVRWLEVSRQGGGVLFAAGDMPSAGSGAPLVRTAGDLEARAVWATPTTANALGGALNLLLQLVAIGRGRARDRTASAEPREHSAKATKATKHAKAPPLPDPPSVHAEVREIYQRAARVARGDVSVLIRGASGTGKELLARYLHQASGRPDDRFVALNCAALPRDLLEAELFGVEQGAATGVDARPGRFELAHDGTLFLDEIGDMSPETQARVLRVVQEGVCHRVGGTRPRPARPRIVSATNRSLSTLMAEGRFRADLYHRISAWEVELPPLARRRGDVANLAIHFLETEARRLGVRPRGISRRALAALETAPWPGNIRQLEQEIRRAALFLEDGDLLETRHLSDELAAVGRDGLGDGTGSQGLKKRLAAFERSEIRAALEAAGGDVSRAAEALGVHRSTLYRRMKALGVDPPGNAD